MEFNFEKAKKSQKQHGYFRIQDLMQDKYTNADYNAASKFVLMSEDIEYVNLYDKGIYGNTYRYKKGV